MRIDRLNYYWMTDATMSQVYRMEMGPGVLRVFLPSLYGRHFRTRNFLRITYAH